jgi:hypothetical protein
VSSLRLTFTRNGDRHKAGLKKRAVCEVAHIRRLAGGGRFKPAYPACKSGEYRRIRSRTYCAGAIIRANIRGIPIKEMSIGARQRRLGLVGNSNAPWRNKPCNLTPSQAEIIIAKDFAFFPALPRACGAISWLVKRTRFHHRQSPWTMPPRLNSVTRQKVAQPCTGSFFQQWKWDEGAITGIGTGIIPNSSKCLTAFGSADGTPERNRSQATVRTLKRNKLGFSES